MQRGLLAGCLQPFLFHHEVSAGPNGPERAVSPGHPDLLGYAPSRSCLER